MILKHRMWKSNHLAVHSASAGVSLCTVKVKYPSEGTKGNTYLSGVRLRADG